MAKAAACAAVKVMLDTYFSKLPMRQSIYLMLDTYWMITYLVFG